MSNLQCCGAKPSWVENVVNKGYWFCGECRNEVSQPNISDIPGFAVTRHMHYDNAKKRWITTQDGKEIVFKSPNYAHDLDDVDDLNGARDTNIAPF